MKRTRAGKATGRVSFTSLYRIRPEAKHRRSGVSDEAPPYHRRLLGGRRRRNDGAAHGAGHDAGARAVGDHRQPGWRGRQRRRGHRGEGGAGRLLTALRVHRACDESEPLPEASFRHGVRFRGHHVTRDERNHASRSSVAAGEASGCRTTRDGEAAEAATGLTLPTLY